jgi:hypothetical protein
MHIQRKKPILKPVLAVYVLCPDLEVSRPEGIQAFVATDTGRWEIRLATLASSIERTEHAAFRPRWLPSREKNLDGHRRLIPFK